MGKSSRMNHLWAVGVYYVDKIGCNGRPICPTGPWRWSGPKIQNSCLLLKTSNVKWPKSKLLLLLAQSADYYDTSAVDVKIIIHAIHTFPQAWKISTNMHFTNKLYKRNFDSTQLLQTCLFPFLLCDEYKSNKFSTTHNWQS